MRIRDLRQYISEITKVDYSIRYLGTHLEPFLIYISGQYQNIEQVKGFIESSSSFATNAEEQLFYEFVQNAYDAKADSLYFFANEQYLIVLNNGEPFYTDLNLLDDEKNKGQLFNFLAKGKSDKRGDEDQMGQYGQGSKLLYTLITDSSDGQLTDADLLVEAIYDKKKGPYLISWNSKDQLTNLLYGEQNWELTQADDYKNNILFAKILYSYFPIAPSQELSLFSNQEASEVISVFDKLVNPRRNFQYMTRGTALIIPLGKGKQSKICSKLNTAKVRTRLSGFSALTAEQSNNRKKLKHIFVFNEEIEESEVVVVFWQKQIGKKTYKFHLAFNPIFAKEGYVNFFKGLPILSTQYHLGFIIDSQCFQTDDSRQRLTNTDTVEHQLFDIFSELVTQLKIIKNDNPEKFNKIYDAIISSKIVKLEFEEYAFVIRPFNTVLKPFLQENIRSNNGEYLNYSKVFTNVTKLDFNIPLLELGIKSKTWVDSTIQNELSQLGLSPGGLDLETVIVESSANLLNEWIENMTDKEYESFQAQCFYLVQQGKLLNTKLFRSNKKNLFTYNEIRSNCPIYYGYGDLTFNGLEYLSCKFDCDSPYDYPLILLDKIKLQLEEFRSSAVLKDTVGKILIYVVNKCPHLKDIVLDLKLFENRQGTVSALRDLFVEVPEGSSLFDDFQVKGYLPTSIKNSRWMLNPKENISKAWEWVVNNVESLIKVKGWELMAYTYIENICSFYNLVPKEKNPSFITNLYFSTSNMPTTVVHSIVKNFSKLRECDYEVLQQTFPNVKLLPYRYLKILSKEPFRLNSVGVSDLIEDGMDINEEQLVVLYQLHDAFLQSYYLKETEKGFKIFLLKGGHNYVNVVDGALETLLLSCGFYPIPTAVQGILHTDAISMNYDLTNNNQLLFSIIKKLDANDLLDLFSLVEKCNDSVLLSYYSNLPELPINNKLDEMDIKWKIIEIAAKRDNGNLKQLIFDKIRCNNSKLSDEIVNETIAVGNHKYEIYTLHEDYKESNVKISTFLSFLPEGKETFFKKEYYKNKQISIGAETIYMKIHQNRLTLEQLKFCLDYAFSKNLGDVKFDTLPSVDVTSILDMVEVNQFKGFDKYYTLPGFNKDAHVYAESDILLEREILPNEIQSWLDTHQNGYTLFNNLRSSKEDLMGYRRIIKRELRYSGSLLLNNNILTKDTLEWLLSKDITCVKDSDQYKNLQDFINALPKDFMNIPLFKYNGEVSMDGISKAIKVNFKFCVLSPESTFLYGAGAEFAECLKSDQDLKTFITNFPVFEHPGNTNIYKHNLTNVPVWEVKHGFENGDYKEFDYYNYEVWKGMRESEGIRLFTSEVPIGITLSIFYAKKELFSIKRKKSECGNNPITKQVVIHYPNMDGLSKMKTIEKYSKGILWLKDPLIALFGLYVNETDELHKIADDNGLDIKDVLEVAKEAVQGTGFDASTIKVMKDNPETIRNLVSSFDHDTLNKINSKASVLQKLLNSFSDKDLITILSLSSDMINSLVKISEDDLELFLNNSDTFKNWLNLGGSGIDYNVTDLVTKFIDGFEYETIDQLSEQLESLHYTYTRFGKDGWKKLKQNTDSVVEIIEEFSENELQKMADSLNNLREFLNELEQDQRTDRDSSISSIIGYIGELIYEQYLVQKHIKYEFSADNGVSQYDFIIYPSSIGKNIYVDVKTSLNTLIDGHTPMYIHKAQDEFLRAHPDLIYRFVRVSLFDLKEDLEKEYESLKDQYGGDSNPRDPNNIGLRKDCQNIAKKYWSKAKIDDFEYATPIYRVEFVS